MDCPTAFHDLLKECRVHDLLCTALSDQGYQSISDFAWAFPSVDRLSIFTNALPESTAQGLTTGDLESSVEIARLRKALDQCHKKTQAPDAGTAFSTIPVDGTPAPAPYTRSSPGYDRQVQGQLSWETARPGLHAQYPPTQPSPSQPQAREKATLHSLTVPPFRQAISGAHGGQNCQAHPHRSPDYRLRLLRRNARSARRAHAPSGRLVGTHSNRVRPSAGQRTCRTSRPWTRRCENSAYNSLTPSWAYARLALASSSLRIARSGRPSRT